MTTDEPQAIAPGGGGTPRTRRIGTGVLARWPTALAVGMTLATLDGGETDSAFEGFGEALPLLALGYLVLAKVRRRRASWPVLLAGLATMTALRALDLVSPVTVWVAAALLVLVWSVVDGQLHDSGTLRVQALGMAGFTVLAVAGLAVDPDVGRYLVAAGWFLHGVWDFVHLRLDKVVARSFAEWCGVFDILVAAQLVLLA